jgi:hypothetical protein
MAPFTKIALAIEAIRFSQRLDAGAKQDTESGSETSSQRRKLLTTAASWEGFNAGYLS